MRGGKRGHKGKSKPRDQRRAITERSYMGKKTKLHLNFNCCFKYLASVQGELGECVKAGGAGKGGRRGYNRTFCFEGENTME